MLEIYLTLPFVYFHSYHTIIYISINLTHLNFETAIAIGFGWVVDGWICKSSPKNNNPHDKEASVQSPNAYVPTCLTTAGNKDHQNA